MTSRPNPVLLAILAALTSCDDSYQDEGCMVVPEGTSECPAAKDVSLDDLFLPGQCGLDIVGVHGAGSLTTVTHQTGVTEPACCYTVDVVDPDPNSHCAVGRPYHEGGAARTTPLDVTPAPEVAFESAESSARAEAWARAGAGEHTSIAAFAKLALQLMAHGAPNDLLARVHTAALDEVRHADVCWTLARRYGARVQARPFPFHEAIDPRIELVALAASAAREGCVVETLGAHLARVASDAAPDPEVRSVLQRIAHEETEHAALSFRIVAWALRAGGPDVREAVLGALREPCPSLDTRELALRAEVPEALLAEALREGLSTVVRPALERLLS